MPHTCIMSGVSQVFRFSEVSDFRIAEKELWTCSTIFLPFHCDVQCDIKVCIDCPSIEAVTVILTIVTWLFFTCVSCYIFAIYIQYDNKYSYLCSEYSPSASNVHPFILHIRWHLWTTLLSTFCAVLSALEVVEGEGRVPRVQKMWLNHTFFMLCFSLNIAARLG
jgi:hypothetical protein